MSYQPPPPEQPQQPQYYAAPPFQQQTTIVTKPKRPVWQFIAGGAVVALLGLCLVCGLISALANQNAKRATTTPNTATSNVPAFATATQPVIARVTATTQDTAVVSVAAPTTPVPVQSTDTVVSVATNIVAPITPVNGANVFEVVPPVTYTPQYTQFLYAVGIIKYHGTDVRTNPKITVTLTDGSGKVLATSNAIYIPSIVRPGTNIPYKALFSSPPVKFDKVEVDIEADQMTSFAEAFYYGDIQVLDPSLVQPKASYDHPKVVGRVKNTGSKTASLIGIVGVLYGADGKVIDVAETFAKKDKVAPSEDSPFQLDFVGVKGGEKFELFTSGLPSQ